MPSRPTAATVIACCSRASTRSSSGDSPARTPPEIFTACRRSTMCSLHTSRVSISAGRAPSGDRVVLWTDADGAGDVIVIDVGSGRRTRLTDSAEQDVDTDWFPSWSPDGSTIVFNSDRDGGDEWTIYAVPAAGGPPRRVT